jgi:hypothetical protein
LWVRDPIGSTANLAWLPIGFFGQRRRGSNRATVTTHYVSPPPIAYPSHLLRHYDWFI